MITKLLQLPVSELTGSVSAAYMVPAESTCLITLAHGAGAGMNHPFMVSLAECLAQAGIATLRFNFPFTEHGKKRVDTPAIAHKTIEVAIGHARKTFPSLPLFASGKSFGGRMSSQLLALQPNIQVRGLIFYGFPLHPAGKPSTDRAAHLKDILLPMLFLQGTRDELATLELIEGVCSTLPTALLTKIEGADHGFKAGKKDTIQLLVSETATWINNVLSSKVNT